MIIQVHVDAAIAGESHKNTEEPVDVDINDTIESAKIKITIIFTELDPSKFYLELQGYRCLPNETILELKKRYQTEPLHFYVRTNAGCCEIM